MKIIGIMGKASSGKNTVAGILAARLVDLGHTVLLDAFATPVKRIARTRGWPGEKDERGRELLQEIGVELRSEDPNVLTKSMDCRVFIHGPGRDYAIISDVRMMNEVEYCREHGVLWHVFGRGRLEGDLGEDVTERLVVEDLPHQKTITSIVNSSSLEDLTKLVHMAVADGRHDKDLI